MRDIRSIPSAEGRPHSKSDYIQGCLPSFRIARLQRAEEIAVLHIMPTARGDLAYGIHLVGAEPFPALAVQLTVHLLQASTELIQVHCVARGRIVGGHERDEHRLVEVDRLQQLADEGVVKRPGHARRSHGPKELDQANAVVGDAPIVDVHDYGLRVPRGELLANLRHSLPNRPLQLAATKPTVVVGVPLPEEPYERLPGSNDALPDHLAEVVHSEAVRRSRMNDSNESQGQNDVFDSWISTERHHHGLEEGRCLPLRHLNLVLPQEHLELPQVHRAAEVLVKGCEQVICVGIADVGPQFRHLCEQVHVRRIPVVPHVGEDLETVKELHVLHRLAQSPEAGQVKPDLRHVRKACGHDLLPDRQRHHAGVL
mmetsp:Transcript_65919/g.143575  ORF Transcript_65919/g.143575 Transcript_65919/m.143575 type:complete len:370 (-) Transcript_65919:1208-2317(-)